MHKEVSHSAPTKYSNVFQHSLRLFFFSGWFPTLIKILSSLCVMFYILYSLKQVPIETEQTAHYISSPEIGDIYFINYPLLEQDVRPNEKFRIAKLVDITGDILTFQYGNLFYVSQMSAEKGIEFGHLRYKKYFELKRYNFSLSEVNQMHSDNIFYQVERPIHGKLHGNFVSPQRRKQNTNIYIPGRKENSSGEGYLKSAHLENNLQLAFEYFTQSAQLNYPAGQANLAQMYLSEHFDNKDYNRALHWLKQASLQSYKPAILKYVIVCQQVPNCNEIEFYQELQMAGVAIKVRSLSQEVKVK